MRKNGVSAADSVTNDKEKYIIELFMQRKLEFILNEEADTPGLRGCLKKLTLSYGDSFNANMNIIMGCKSIAKYILQIVKQFEEAEKVSEKVEEPFDIRIDTEALTAYQKHRKDKATNDGPNSSVGTSRGQYALIISDPDTDIHHGHKKNS